MCQSWQLWASLPGQNSIHNHIFSSTTILRKQLRRLHWSEQVHSVAPTAACNQLARCSPKAVSSRTSEDSQHDMGTCSSSVSPLHLRGRQGTGACLVTPHFPAQPAPSQCPCRAGEAAVGMWGGCDFLERLGGPAGGSKPKLKCRVCTLISALLPLALRENGQQRYSQPLPLLLWCLCSGCGVISWSCTCLPSLPGCYKSPVVT